MPQHAVSAGQPHTGSGEAGDHEEKAPALHDDAYTFSPPIAGNDVSGELEDPSQPAAAPVAASVEEAPRDGSNDNIPTDRALVVVSDDTALAIAVADPPVQRRFSRPVAMAAAAGVLVLGTVGFLYAGFPRQPRVQPPQTQLAASPSSTEQTAGAEFRTAAARDIAAPAATTARATVAPIAAEPSPVLDPAPVAGAATASPSAQALPAEPAAPRAAASLGDTPAIPEPAARPVADAAAAPPTAVEASRAPTPSLAPPPGSSRVAAPSPGAEASRLAALPSSQTAPNSGPPRPPIGLPTPAAQGPARGQVVFVQRPDVNIRNQPSQAGQVVGMAHMGGRFVVAGREGEWVMVGQGPWRGWIHQRFLAPRLPRG